MQHVCCDLKAIGFLGQGMESSWLLDLGSFAKNNSSAAAVNVGLPRVQCYCSTHMCVSLTMRVCAAICALKVPGWWHPSIPGARERRTGS